MLNTEFLRHLISIAMETGYDPALIKVNVFRCNLWRFCENHKSFDKDNKIHLEHVVSIQNAFLHIQFLQDFASTFQILITQLQSNKKLTQ